MTFEEWLDRDMPSGLKWRDHLSDNEVSVMRMAWNVGVMTGMENAAMICEANITKTTDPDAHAAYLDCAADIREAAKGDK